MELGNLSIYVWAALGVLLVGSIYLIYEGYKVHKLFADSIVGKLVKALVVVFLIELYSLGLVSYAFFFFYPRAGVVLFPIFLLWILSLVFAIFAIRSAKKQMVSITQ